ncbi:MAG: hypothetical protein ACE145_08735 [Terriglobia bacterium]
MNSFPLKSNRRNFLGRCAGCVAAAFCAKPLVGADRRSLLPLRAGSGQAPTAATSGATAAAGAGNEKTILRLVFTHISPDKETWPYQGYDYDGRKKELTARLVEACPKVEFLPATAQNAEQAKKILADGAPADGNVVYLVGIWSGAAEVFASSGQPVLLVDDAYAGSGEFLIQYAAARRKGLKVAGVSSSRFEDAVSAIHAFEALKKMRSSVILDVDEGEPGAQDRAIEAVFGTKVRRTSAEEINAAYRRANLSEARECAARWMGEARQVVEPSREEIEKSAAIYLAMRELMKEHNARAITVDCLTLFYGGKLPAYPCLGFFQMNNDGLVGACEGDLESTVSMLLGGYLVGRPGYISDPVIDTSLNRIIYAHCVAPSKVFGPAGRPNPYDIRSHSEDRKGACVRSLMPLGEIVTTLKFDPARKEVVMHLAKTVENIDEDKACRTKLAAEVSDIDKLMSEWDRWGWHRVTFYGDHKRAVETVAALAGFRTVWEA